jgi:hypothetical protein
VKALEEKELFLEEAAKNDYILFFEHDFYTECASVVKTQKGFISGKKFSWDERS